MEAHRRSYIGIPSWSWAGGKLNFGLNIRDRDNDDVTRGSVQPPLRVSTNEGKGLDVDLMLLEANARIHAVVDMEVEGVGDLVSKLQIFYRELRAAGPSEVPSRPGPGSVGREDGIIEVEGILLTLPVGVITGALFIRVLISRIASFVGMTCVTWMRSVVILAPQGRRLTTNFLLCYLKA